VPAFLVAVLDVLIVVPWLVFPPVGDVA